MASRQWRPRPDNLPEGVEWCMNMSHRDAVPVEKFQGKSNGELYKTCVDCRDRKRREYADDPEVQDRAKANASRYYHEHKEEIEITSKAWRDSHPVEIFAKRLWTNFRITLEQYDAMLLQQNYLCAICQMPDPRGGRLAVDHDHNCCPGKKSCGKCVRGLVCTTCNTGMGNFHDNVELLYRAIWYLENTNADC